MRLLLIPAVLVTVLVVGACGNDEAPTPSGELASTTTTATSPSQPPAETTDTSSISSTPPPAEDNAPLKEYEFTGIGYYPTGVEGEWTTDSHDMPTLITRDGKLVAARTSDGSMTCDLQLNYRLSPARALLMMGDPEYLRSQLQIGQTGTFPFLSFEVEVGEVTCTRHN